MSKRKFQELQYDKYFTCVQSSICNIGKRLVVFWTIYPLMRLIFSLFCIFFFWPCFSFLPIHSLNLYTYQTSLAQIHSFRPPLKLDTLFCAITADIPFAGFLLTLVPIHRLHDPVRYFHTFFCVPQVEIPHLYHSHWPFSLFLFSQAKWWYLENQSKK